MIRDVRAPPLLSPARAALAPGAVTARVVFAALALAVAALAACGPVDAAPCASADDCARGSTCGQDGFCVSGEQPADAGDDGRDPTDGADGGGRTEDDGGGAVGVDDAGGIAPLDDAGGIAGDDDAGGAAPDDAGPDDAIDAGDGEDDAGDSEEDAGEADEDAGSVDEGDAGVDAGGAPDAGGDPGVDAGGDAGVDAGADAGVDAGADAGFEPPDAGFDAGFDAGVDPGVDAGTDAGIEPGDAGPGVDAGIYIERAFANVLTGGSTTTMDFVAGDVVIIYVAQAIADTTTPPSIGFDNNFPGAGNLTFGPVRLATYVHRLSATGEVELTISAGDGTTFPLIAGLVVVRGGSDASSTLDQGRSTNADLVAVDLEEGGKPPAGSLAIVGIASLSDATAQVPAADVPLGVNDQAGPLHLDVIAQRVGGSENVVTYEFPSIQKALFSAQVVVP